MCMFSNPYRAFSIHFIIIHVFSTLADIFSDRLRHHSAIILPGLNILYLELLFEYNDWIELLKLI